MNDPKGLVLYLEDDPRNARVHEDFLNDYVRNLMSDTAVLLTSMPPIVTGTPRVLVLGSMPGELSLRRGEYYANPQNRFWSLMEDIHGAPRSADYERLRQAWRSIGHPRRESVSCRTH